MEWFLLFIHLSTIFSFFNYLNIYGDLPFQFWNWSYFNGGTVHLKLEDQWYWWFGLTLPSPNYCSLNSQYGGYIFPDSVWTLNNPSAKGIHEEVNDPQNMQLNWKLKAFPGGLGNTYYWGTTTLSGIHCIVIFKTNTRSVLPKLFHAFSLIVVSWTEVRPKTNQWIWWKNLASIFGLFFKQLLNHV